MTSVAILKKDNRSAGFIVSGHSGYADSGSDIVCAALSSAVQQTMIAITEIMNLDTEVSVDSENALIEYRLPANISKEEVRITGVVLEAFEKNCRAIADEYPQAVQIQLSEVEL